MLVMWTIAVIEKELIEALAGFAWKTVHGAVDERTRGQNFPNQEVVIQQTARK